ncbi:hypothetical protein JAAARDRAFT_133826 [Jaapia argillacea MUCL 33604]|uniref:Protein kinase domain-containing protein n=1 Tax=Jaapia argillacea MUCL 33604 TaxID=933084 RepID=A0A067PNI5_9AGAM|nr:hypothetical protein JAAARDRAFT_133826 [Jaapia argillacea MUCL 33604]
MSTSWCTHGPRHGTRSGAPARLCSLAPLAILGSLSNVSTEQRAQPLILVQTSLRRVVQSSLLNIVADTCFRVCIQKLLMELRTWRHLRHPNIGHFLGLTWHWHSIPSIVYARHENGNINEYLERNPEIDPFPLLVEIASALSYMHSLSPPVVHGGLKASNILVSESGRPLLVDFGLRIVVHDSRFGTEFSHRWIAPESFNPQACTRRPAIDVYSFGMTILEVLTGLVPFSDLRSCFQVIINILHEVRPCRPRDEDTRTRITDDTWNLLQSCWQHAPEDRPSIDTVRAWLELQILIQDM